MSLYGALFWDLGSKNTVKFYVTWRKCVRKLMNLPYRTHSRFLPVLCGDISVEYQLFKRVNKIFWNLHKSTNSCLNLCAKLIEKGSCSNFSKSVSHICKSLKLNRFSFGIPPSNFSNILNDKFNMLYSESDFITMGNIKDLLYLRDVDNSFFSACEINNLLNVLCTD